MARMRLFGSLIFALSFACSFAAARAASALPEESPTTSEPPVSSPSEPVARVSPGRNDAWQGDYSRARADLVAGHFPQAAQQFRVLAQAATDPFDRRLASEQADLATEWTNRRLVLSLQSTHDAGVGEAPSNRRSIDEISILYTNAVVYGIGSGIALATVTKPNSAGGVILPTLGLAGTAAGAVALADGSPHELPYGVPQSMVSGMYIGLEEGLTWVLWNQARANRSDEWSVSTVSTLIWGSTTIGAAVGGIVGSVRGATPGRASFVGSTSLWAGAIAGLTAAAFGSRSDDYRDDHGLLAGAIGVNVGAVGGMLAAGNVSPSIARVRFLDLGAVSGGLVVGGLYLATIDKKLDERLLMGSTAAGIGAGLGIAWYATRGMAKDLGPGAHEPSLLQSLRPTFAPTQGGALLALNGEL